MRISPMQKIPCPKCRGKRFIEVKTAGGMDRRRCVACGGTGEAGPRTK